MSQLTLGLVIHNHQPVGNFDHVVAEATDRAYDPLIRALERHPHVRLALHYSGSLLDWLRANRPDHLDALAHLVEREQVELLTGGYYEPILVAIPEIDRLGQIRKMNDHLSERFGVTPSGAWVAERIWEPHLPKSLAQAGVQYTVLDDTPLKMAGLHDHDLFVPHVTEEEGFSLKVFGNLTYLRYAIPWRPVDTVIGWLRQQAESHPGGVAVSADDGEKFGLWPQTWEHCWGERGWVDTFFTALEENSDWLRTLTLGEVASLQHGLKRVYLPCGSYAEMMRWARPPDTSASPESRQLDLDEEGDGTLSVRGAAWRSFLSRYDEINQMHKKMLWVSRKAHGLANGEAKTQALEHTWSAQGGCGYWHGRVGGIYLFHIRVANYAHLIAAEEVVDRATRESAAWTQVEQGDLDGDSEEEIILNTDRQVLTFKPSYGGALVEWDWRDRRYNLLNTMTRRREGYHRALREAAEQGRLVLPEQRDVVDGIRVQEPDVHTRLFYDWYRRVAFLDHFLHADTTPEDFYQARYGEQGDFVAEPYRVELVEGDGAARLTMTREGTVWEGEVAFAVRVQKRISVKAGSPLLAVRYRVTNLDDIPADLRFAVELNWGIVGGGSRHGYLHVDSKRRSLADFGGDQDVSSVSLGSTLPDLAGEVEVVPSRPAHLWHFPLETVSDSEAGYERAYQGTCTLLWWVVPLEPRLPWDVRLTLALRDPSG